LASNPTYQLQEALLDPGISAGKGRHRAVGALGRFIAGAEAGTVPPGAVLIVESFTRFSRENERTALGVLLNDFWARGLGLAICGHDEIYTAELIDSQPHRLHVLLALMQQARAEWLEKSRRSKGARAAARAKQDEGIRTAHRVPFTILTDDNGAAIRDAAGMFQLDPVNAETVRLMVELHQQGNGGTNIAKALNKAGRPTRGKAKQWSGEEVRKVLRAPFIMGTLSRSTGNVDNYFPAIVDAATFQQIQQLSAERTFGSTNLKGNAVSVNNLFQGANSCPLCGATISHAMAGGVSNGGRRYVVCRGALRLKQCKAGSYTPNTAWELTGLAMIRSADWASLLLRPEEQANLQELQQQHNAAESQAIELQRLITTQERRAEEAWATGVTAERLDTIERVLTRSRQELQQAQRDRDAAAQQLALAISQPNPSDQALLIQQRVQELLPNLADPEHRAVFNRWLRSTKPTIRFKLYPNQQMELLVDDRSVAIAKIDEGSSRIVLNMGGHSLRMHNGQPTWQTPDDGHGAVDCTEDLSTDDYTDEDDYLNRTHPSAT
jgi:DNA invertase Pin-like site-specific DNA recombinase